MDNDEHWTISNWCTPALCFSALVVFCQKCENYLKNEKKTKKQKNKSHVKIKPN